MNDESCKTHHDSRFLIHASFSLLTKSIYKLIKHNARAFLFCYNYAMSSKHIISSTKEYTSPWFWVEKETIKYPSGIERDYYIVNTQHPFVGIVAFYKDKLIVQRQWRPVIKDWLWELPFGGVEEEETLEQAIKRELLEETGYQANTITKIGSSYAAIGFTTAKGHIFTTQDLTYMPEKAENNPSEIIEVHLKTKAEFESMIADGMIQDAPTLAAWSMYKAKIK